MISLRQNSARVAERTARNKFTIDVFPHIKKFILKNHDATNGSIKVENNDQFRDRLTTTLTLELTKKQTQLGPRVSKLMRVNTDMDRVFKEHLLCWIKAQSALGIPPFTACRTFLEYYAIDESEYSLEAAHRFYQRSKE
jgi:hypothetical protein